MTSSNLNKKVWQWSLLIFLAFIWGSSFILMKKGLRSYTHDQVAALRMFISFLAFLPFGIKSFKKITKENYKSLILVGYIGSAIPAFLFTKAQTRIDSSLAGMLNSMTPLFTLIIGLLFYNSKARLIHAVGIFLGLIGALGLIMYTSGRGELFSNINYYGLFIVIATICYGINVNQVKYKIKDLNGLELTALAFMFVGPFAGIYLLFSDFSFALSTPDYLLNLGYISILSVVGTMMALAIFNSLIQYTSALFGSSVTYIIPVFAIMWGLFDGEKISVFHFLWISLIFIGVYLVNLKKRNET